VKAPQLTHRVDPSYTDAARAARTTGIVVIAVLIDKSGAVADTQVLKGLPDGLTEAALAAVRQWTFAPSMRDGVAIDVVFTLTVNFKVDHKAN
ncbi:MAG: energy transducer TonB, partial [Acidimicrobiales bacterium]